MLDEYCKYKKSIDPNYVCSDIPKSASSGSAGKEYLEKGITTYSESDRAKAEELQAKIRAEKQQSSGDNSLSFDTDVSQVLLVGIAIVILAIIIAVAKSRGKTDSNQYVQQKYVSRRGFSWQTKEQVKLRQRGRCVKCDRYPTHWEFHHIAGRDNNDISNCQGLCHDCHDDKTF